MTNIRGMVQDPDFQKLTPEQKRELLTRAGAPPGFIDELLGPQDMAAEPAPAAAEPTFLEKLQAGLKQIVQQKIPGPVAAVVPGGNLARDPTGVSKIPGTDVVVGGGGDASLEQLMENLPIVGGVIGGTVAGGPVGGLAAALLGTVGGEGWRQVGRRAADLPAATGLVQDFMGLDPDSPEAAAASLGGETTATLLGAGASKVLGGLAKMTDRSSLRSLINLLQPKTARDHANAMDLAARIRDEGLAPVLSSRESQLKNANRILDEATNDLDNTTRPLFAAGAAVPTQGIQDRVAKVIPRLLPSGAVPETGIAQREAAERALNDVLDALGGGNQPTVPLKTVIDEKGRWDEVTKAFYEGGRDTVPQGVKYSENAGNAFRQAMRQYFPEVGEKSIRKSDLLDITRLLKKALDKSVERGGLGTANQESQAFLRGTPSVIASLAAQTGIGGSGPWASMSSAAKALAAKVLEGGAESAQVWIRAADAVDLESDTTPEIETRPEDAAIEELAKNILGRQQGIPVPSPPPPPISEEEFIRRYQ